MTRFEYFTDFDRRQFRIVDAETAQTTIGFAYKVEHARLLAAAPAMLAALKAVLDYCSYEQVFDYETGEPLGFDPEWVVAARNAVALASNNDPIC